jgi:methyl-accepting chemotaxis protein
LSINNSEKSIYEFFKSISVQYKILLIPLVGAVGFCIYLAISMLSMSSIVDQLDKAYRVEYQLLQTSEYSLVRLDKIKETLGNAATSGETELLDVANNYANEIRDKLKSTMKIDKDSVASLKRINDAFDNYYQIAFELSKEMVEGTADFSTLGQRS